MKIIDIVITIISGEAAAIVFSDFLGDYPAFLFLRWVFLFSLPVLGVLVYWLCDLVSKKFIPLLQFLKYCLVGVISVLFDLKVFEFFIWIFGSSVGILAGTAKSISFLIATFSKFVGNKYWTFEKPDKTAIRQEFISFLIITFLGLIIDVGGYFFFYRVVGPQFGLSINLWSKVSVILSGVFAAIWNFLGYKFIIFKK